MKHKKNQPLTEHDAFMIERVWHIHKYGTFVPYEEARKRILAKN